MTTRADFLAEAGDLFRAEGVAVSIIDRVLAELRRRYGGDRVLIHKIDRERRNAGIRQDLQSGLPIPVVAKRQACSPTTVQRVKRDEWNL